jgi:ankyrin repeat protein
MNLNYQSNITVMESEISKTEGNSLSVSSLSDTSENQNKNQTIITDELKEISAQKNDKQRHLQVWNKFFENAFSIRELAPVVSETPNITKTFDKCAAFYGFTPSVHRNKRLKVGTWYSKISQHRYLSLQADALSQNLEKNISSPKFLPSILLSVALISAVVKDDINAINQLLLKGADPNCFDEQFRTPSHYACRFQSIGYKTLAVLYDHGADLTLSDK